MLRGRKIKPEEEAAHGRDIENFPMMTRKSTEHANGDGKAPESQMNGSDSSQRAHLPHLDTSVQANDAQKDIGSSNEARNEPEDPLSPSQDHIRFGDNVESRPRIRKAPTTPVRPRSHSRVFSMVGVGARPDLMNDPRTAEPLIPEKTDGPAMPHRPSTAGSMLNKYIASINGYVGRNSAFHNLTIAEREKLGGLEYQAVSILSIIVLLYFIVRVLSPLIIMI